MGNHQSKLAVLWLGALISGMARNILQHIHNGLLSVVLHAAAWTNTAHSFISLRPSRTYGVARFGATPLCETEIEVRQHAKCSGHYLRYLGWCWELDRGVSSMDTGFRDGSEYKDAVETADSLVPLQSQSLKDRQPRSEDLSEMATYSSFCWLRATSYPRSEQGIYRHLWIDPDVEDSSDDELND